MTTMTDVKNLLDKVQELVNDSEFIECVALALQENGCTPEDWEANKVFYLMAFAQKIVTKAEENN
jgi:hypothetical protein